MAKEKENTVASVAPTTTTTTTTTTSAVQENVLPPKTIVSGQNGNITDKGSVIRNHSYSGIDYVGC